MIKARARPKGKMIEGRSGGSGRSTRSESWAPPDSGSSTSGSYVVSCTDARPSPPTHFLPSAASSPVAPACWPRGKIPPHPSARSARHSSPQDGGPKGKMIEGRSGGSGRSTRSESWAPPESLLPPHLRQLREACLSHWIGSVMALPSSRWE